MPVLVGLFALAAAIVFWTVRAHTMVKTVREIDRDTRGLQRRVGAGLETLIGTKLGRVGDPRLAAVILMIQLVRTGSPVTAQEKTQIMEWMEDPLRIQNISATFEKAWSYTTQRLFFSAVSDELLPMLRDNLDQPSRLELIAMLTKVANAYNGASDLQREGIARLKTRLMQL